MNQGESDPSGWSATTSSRGSGRCRAPAAWDGVAIERGSSVSDSAPKTRQTASGYAWPR